VIDGIRFVTDPEFYSGPQVERRSSTHRSIGGGTTIQDFGNAVSAEPVRLRSGAQKLDHSTMQRLQELMLKGGSHVVTDWIGNDYQAFMSQFDPRPSGALSWAYEMKLQAHKISKLRGVPYDGRR
jgi:hypothetical protein